MFEGACHTLNFKPRPQLFVQRELAFGTVTCGVENTLIILVRLDLVGF